MIDFTLVLTRSASHIARHHQVHAFRACFEYRIFARPVFGDVSLCTLELHTGLEILFARLLS